LLLALACSSDDRDAVDPFAPLGSGAPAPDGFAAAVTEATVDAGELTVEQDVVIAGQALAESSGVVDLGAGTADLELIVNGPGGETRIAQVLEGGRMTERDLDRPGARPNEVDASGGGPLQLPQGDTVDDASGVVDALEAALLLAALVQHDLGDTPPGTTCWAGDVAGPYRQRIEVCIDDRVGTLRRLRSMTESMEGLVGVTTIVLSAPG
jgi:hypothetical protein